MLNLVLLRHYLRDGALVEAVQYRGNLTEAEAAAIHRWIEVGGGTVEPTADDWVIRDNTGAFILCKPETFEQEYEPVA